MGRRGGIKTGSISSSTRWGIPAQAIKAGRQPISSQVQAAHFALYALHGRSALQHPHPPAGGVHTPRRPAAQSAGERGEALAGLREPCDRRRRSRFGGPDQRAGAGGARPRSGGGFRRGRSEERRVGTGGVRQRRFGGGALSYKKK